MSTGRPLLTQVREEDLRKHARRLQGVVQAGPVAALLLHAWYCSFRGCSSCMIAGSTEALLPRRLLLGVALSRNLIVPVRVL